MNERHMLERLRDDADMLLRLIQNNAPAMIRDHRRGKLRRSAGDWLDKTAPEVIVRDDVAVVFVVCTIASLLVGVALGILFAGGWA